MTGVKQNRDFARLDQPVGHAPHQQPPQATVAVGAHHHQVDVVRLDVVNDVLGRVSLGHVRPFIHLDAGLFQLSLQLVDVFCPSLNSCLGQPVGLLDFNLHHLHRLHVSPGAQFMLYRHRVNQVNGGPQLLGQIARGGKHLLGKLETVERDPNIFKHRQLLACISFGTVGCC